MALRHVFLSPVSTVFAPSSLRTPTPGTMTTHTHTQRKTLAFSVRASLAAKVVETNNYTLSWGLHIILF